MSRMHSRAAGACLKFIPLIVTGSMVLAACGSEAKQAPQAEASHPAYSVVDVLLGMTPAEVETALKGKGFEVTEDPTNDTFVGYLNSARAQATNTLPKLYEKKALTTIHGRKGGETIDVGLTDLQGGPVVSTLTYHAPAAGKTFADVKADLSRRYGPSVDENPGVTTNWCTNLGSSCRLDKPALRLAMTGPIEIRLYDGGQATATRQAQVKAALAKEGPAKSSY